MVLVSVAIPIVRILRLLERYLRGQLQGLLNRSWIIDCQANQGLFWRFWFNLLLPYAFKGLQTLSILIFCDQVIQRLIKCSPALLICNCQCPFSLLRRLNFVVSASAFQDIVAALVIITPFLLIDPNTKDTLLYDSFRRKCLVPDPLLFKHSIGY